MTETLIPPKHLRVYRHNYALPETDGRTLVRKISVYLQSVKIQKILINIRRQNMKTCMLPNTTYRQKLGIFEGRLATKCI